MKHTITIRKMLDDQGVPCMVMPGVQSGYDQVFDHIMQELALRTMLPIYTGKNPCKYCGWREGQEKYNGFCSLVCAMTAEHYQLEYKPSPSAIELAKYLEKCRDLIIQRRAILDQFD